jgi:hypothetical protein
MMNCTEELNSTEWQGGLLKYCDQYWVAGYCTEVCEQYWAARWSAEVLWTVLSGRVVYWSTVNSTEWQGGWSGQTISYNNMRFEVLTVVLLKIQPSKILRWVISGVFTVFCSVKWECFLLTDWAQKSGQQHWLLCNSDVTWLLRFWWGCVSISEREYKVINGITENCEYLKPLVCSSVVRNHTNVHGEERKKASWVVQNWYLDKQFSLQSW